MPQPQEPTQRPTPLVAVDVLIFTIETGELRALVAQVKDGPYCGQWAFPGGLIPQGEAPEDTATRELYTQTGLRDVYLEQLRTFGAPARDQRTHVVTIAYFALVPAPSLTRHDNPKYAQTQWCPVRSLPPLAYDHNQIAAYAWARLTAKLSYTNIVYNLLPEEFTLRELQRVYETILGRQLDRRNFRKKILTLGLLCAANRQRRGAHRPAQLYRFTHRTPRNIHML